ncbi:SAF domain-containing protein [Arcanobacterium buesumense]|uniref:SAF domain-containing protein n=1 Tax=Arcanobacterium buesumense TaxID=2722751 RepID=A0A6H2EJ25_9ACTO|nr:SAF domain-containing protein [Arcanobacterium buesumense]QJC21326.1 hypothetical protein HC352_01520 [Arcanobacterium buesumense]
MISLERFTHRARDPRLLLGMVLIIGGGVGGAALAGTPDIVMVAQAKTDIAAGNNLNASDFALVPVPRDIAASYVQNLDFADGSRVRKTVSAGELLAVSSIGRHSGGVAVTLPLSLPVASDMTPGDEVMVWRVPHNKDSQASTVAQHSTFVRLLEQRSIGDGHLMAEIRVNQGALNAIVEALGQGDNFAVFEAQE